MSKLNRKNSSVLKPQKKVFLWKEKIKSGLTHFCTVSVGNYQNPRRRTDHMILIKVLCLFHTSMEQ